LKSNKTPLVEKQSTIVCYRPFSKQLRPIGLENSDSSAQNHHFQSFFWLWQNLQIPWERYLLTETSYAIEIGAIDSSRQFAFFELFSSNLTEKKSSEKSPKTMHLRCLPTLHAL
jgi:hypothetical protein